MEVLPLWSPLSISIIEIDSISGYCLYIEASNPRRKGDRAILQSPEIYSDSAACLRFKAHMYSYFKDRMGTLEILMKEKWSKNTKIFTKGGDQGNQWLSYNVDLPKGGPYKVLIHHYSKFNAEVGYQIMISFISTIGRHWLNAMIE